VALRRRAVLRRINELNCPWAWDDDIRGAVLVPKGMPARPHAPAHSHFRSPHAHGCRKLALHAAPRLGHAGSALTRRARVIAANSNSIRGWGACAPAHDNRPLPAGDDARNVGHHDRLAEDGAVEDVADGPVGAQPHALEAELGHARLVGRDRRALDAHADALRQISALHVSTQVSFDDNASSALKTAGIDGHSLIHSWGCEAMCCKTPQWEGTRGLAVIPQSSLCSHPSTGEPLMEGPGGRSFYPPLLK
jgi:hypothetical protein